MSADLRVVTKTYDLILWLIPRVEKFPRSQRFVLGDRIETTALEILETLIDAASEPDKGVHLRRANLALEKLRYLIRIAKDLRFISLAGKRCPVPFLRGSNPSTPEGRQKGRFYGDMSMVFPDS